MLIATGVAKANVPIGATQRAHLRAWMVSQETKVGNRLALCKLTHPATYVCAFTYKGHPVSILEAIRTRRCTYVILLRNPDLSVVSRHALTHCF
jgi:hypothetical protein